MLCEGCGLQAGGMMGRGLRMGRTYKKRWVYWEADLAGALGRGAFREASPWQVELTTGSL